MKHTTCGKSNSRNWYGLNFITKVPMSWTVTVETLGLGSMEDYDYNS